MEDLSHLTGEDKMRKPPEAIKCNEVRVNGKTGKFLYIDLINRKEGEKAEVVELGDGIKVIFLKHRRRLAYYDKPNKRMIQTTEHNSKTDTVYLFGLKERGPADLMRENHQKLRTQQLVYAFLIRENDKGSMPEMVRLIFKGSALLSEATPEGVMKYYDYVSSFKGKDHSYQFITELASVQEKSDLGDYYSVSFSRGPKVSAQGMEAVATKIKELAETTNAQDAYYKQEQLPAEPQEDMPTIEYPEDEANPDDIPF